MLVRRLVIALLALAGLAVLPSAASAYSDPQQWTVVDNPSGTVMTDTPYAVKNTKIGKQIGYEDRTGVDLGWNSKSRFEFRRSGRDHRAIPARSSDPVAIFDPARNKFLVNKGQTFGIDLDWSSTPKYEWRVNPQRKADGTTSFSLYNDSARDYVVYGSRWFGINLVWSGNGFGDITFTVPRMQYPYPKGFWFFQGLTSLDTKDTARSIQNLNSVPVRFYRDGEDYLGNCCPDVTVPPSGYLTEQQMQLVFGTKTPRFGLIRVHTTSDVQLTQLAFRVVYVDK